MEQGRGYAQRHRVQLEARVFATIVEHDHGQELLQLTILAKIQQIFMRGGGQCRGHERWKVGRLLGKMGEWLYRRPAYDV